MRSSLLTEKPLLIEKSKAEEIFFGKKKKEEKKSSTLASIFRTKKSSSKQNLPYIMLKTRSPFIYASTSLIQIVILKGVCRSVVLLLSTFSCFSILAFGDSAHYYVVLLKVPLSDRVCNGFLFPGNLDPSSLTQGGPVVPLVCGFRRRVRFRISPKIPGILTNESVSANFDI